MARAFCIRNKLHHWGFRFVVVIAVLMFACVCALMPATAHATYKDVSNEYYASQDVAVSGSPLDASQIPTGSYNITVSSSSSMCQPTNCVLTVSGGQLYVEFTLTGAYTALYFGTAEEAATRTNEDGTDASQYYLGQPSEGYVPHQYAIVIPALNSPIDVATYTGGKDFEKGMWWSRQFSFNSKGEVDAAISGGFSEGEQSGGDQGGGNESSENGESNQDSDTSGSETTDEGSEEDEGHSVTIDPDDEESENEQTNSTANSETESNSESNNESTEEEEEEDEEEAAPATGGSGLGTASAGQGTGSSGAAQKKDASASAASASAEAATKNAPDAKMGKGIKLVSKTVDPLDAAGDWKQGDSGEPEQRDLLPLVVAAVVIGLFDLGLVGAFLIGLRRTKPKSFPRV